jgi:hypothetical protein
MATMAERFSTFGDFWPFYLREHAQPATRALHIAGTWTALVLLLFGLLIGPWWLILVALAVGYGAAWVSHMAIEHNRPATFTYPTWSLLADLRLAWLAATGRLEAELQRNGL